MDMKDPKFLVFGVIERNVLTVKMIDMEPITEKVNMAKSKVSSYGVTERSTLSVKKKVYKVPRREKSRHFSIQGLKLRRTCHMDGGVLSPLFWVTLLVANSCCIEHLQASSLI